MHCPGPVSWFRQLPHGVRERRAEHFHVEVYGIAGQIAVGPSPIRRLENQALILFHLQVAAAAIAQGKAAPLEQRRQFDDAGGADLFAGPRLLLPTARVPRRSRPKGGDRNCTIDERR